MFPFNFLVMALAAVGPLLSGGHGWVRRGSSPDCIQRFVTDTSNPPVVYGAGTATGVLYRSGDGGSSWTPINRPPGFLSSLLVSPTRSSTLFAVSEGFYVSRDSGVSWERSLSAPPYLSGPLIQDPFDSDTMYVATSCCFGRSHFTPEVWVTADAGTHWSLRSGGLSQGGGAEFILGLIAHPREPGVLLASLTTGVYRTADQGRSWTRLSETDVGALAGFDSGSELVWATKAGMVWRSLDGGGSWDAVNVRLNPESGGVPYVHGLVADPVRPNTAYAVVDTDWYGSYFDSGVQQTRDAGSSWTIPSGIPGSEATRPGFPPVQSRWVRGLSASREGSLWVSACGESNDVYVLDGRSTREIDPR